MRPSYATGPLPTDFILKEWTLGLGRLMLVGGRSKGRTGAGLRGGQAPAPAPPSAHLEEVSDSQDLGAFG